MTKNNNKMMISSRMGHTQGGWSALPEIPEMEEAKHLIGSG